MVRRWFRTFWCVGQQWCSRRLCAEVKIVGTTTIISKRCHHHHYYYYYYNFVCVYVACSVHSATIKWKRQQHLQMVLALSVEYTIIMHKRPGYNGIASSDWAFFTAQQKGDCVWANQTKIKTLFPLVAARRWLSTFCIVCILTTFHVGKYWNVTRLEDTMLLTIPLCMLVLCTGGSYRAWRWWCVGIIKLF